MGDLMIDSAGGQLTVDTLPIEVQDLIFDFVIDDATREDLKAFRKSNRYFRDRADIHLFSTVHISASNLSLDRVKHISETAHLSVHVKELVFHRGTFSGHRMVKLTGRQMRPRDYDEFETYLVQHASKHIPRSSEAYIAFMQELDAEMLFNREVSWRSALRKYCPRFPKLEKLTTLSFSEDTSHSTYFDQRCGLRHQSWTPNYFAPYEIFDSLGLYFHPRALSFDYVNGEDFAAIISNIRGGLPVIAERFSQLRSFRLSFSETVASLDTEGTYDLFFQACPNLQQLSLNFHSWDSNRILKETESFPRKLLKAIFDQHFAHLEHLSLTHAPMSEDDFITFLQRHAKTLRALELVGWHMPVDASDQPTGSIIRALYRLGLLEMGSLRSVTLLDGFSNHIDGHGWYLFPPQSHTTISEQPEELMINKLTRYVQNGGKCDNDFPVPISKKLLEEAKTGQELKDLDRLSSRLGCEDETFKWL